MSGVRDRIWPWSELASLRRELRAARLACSAEMKKTNRLTRRILVLDEACAKHHRQERHDQAYIDALESKLTPGDVENVKRAMAERDRREALLREQRIVEIGGERL